MQKFKLIEKGVAKQLYGGLAMYDSIATDGAYFASSHIIRVFV